MTAQPVPVPDYTSWSEADLIAHINALNAAYAAKQRENEQTEADTRAAVTTAIAGLDALIGPDNPTAPGLGSISEMLKYTDEQLGQYAGLALRQVLLGMQIQARLTRDLARVVGD